MREAQTVEKKSIVGASIARPCLFALEETFPENALLR